MTEHDRKVPPGIMLMTHHYHNLIYIRHFWEEQGQQTPKWVAKEMGRMDRFFNRNSSEKKVKVASYVEMKMKQGKSRDSDFRKREPIPKAVHETAASELGRAVQYTKSPLYGGQGLKPPGPSPSRAGPGGGRVIHPSGTQGKHR